MENYKVDIPLGQIGEWKVVRHTVTQEEEKLGRIRAIFSGHGRFTPAGTYTGLEHNNELVMSDAPDEIRDHMEAIYQAKGNVLINGLGIGMVVKACLEKNEVNHVTVIEISPQVIELVGKYYQEKYGNRLTIINADALTWKPPKNTRYNMVWHDIWNTICSDNLPEMHKLHRKYGKIADWQGSWCRRLCE